MLLLQAIQEYINDNHPEWKASINQDSILLIQHKKFLKSPIWIYFYQNPPRLNSTQITGQETSKDTITTYTEGNVFQIITDIINDT